MQFCPFVVLEKAKDDVLKKYCAEWVPPLCKVSNGEVVPDLDKEKECMLWKGCGNPNGPTKV